MIDGNALGWRRGLVSLCAFGFVFWLFKFFQIYAWLASPGFYPSTTEVPFRDVVIGVRAGSTAAKAGIKVGDAVDLRSVSPSDRWAFRWRSLLSGRPYTYVIHRGASQQRVTLQTHRESLGLGWTSFYIGALGALIFAAIVAWRRPWLVEARMLCLLLIAHVMNVFLVPLNWQTPWPRLDFAAAMVWVVVQELELSLLVAYTFLFGRPISKLRVGIAVCAFLIIAFDLAFNLTSFAGTWTGAFDLMGGPIATSALLSFW